ncbi:DUF6445 family protein [Novosphingobium terrae]|uniref:DUF6445 family protein n=1 Tax=Novosphingobium terrae TaxID=2726189 RepID=UPI00197FD0AC|nr:DUF6445 family protein [Novosphingobium terrae]
MMVSASIVGSQTSVSLLRLQGSDEPVLVMDAATGQAEHLIAAASASRFEPASAVGSGYPGLLGPAPHAYVDAMVRFVLPLLQQHWHTGPIRPKRARGNFSLVATPPEALSAEQRMPHVDAADPLQFAAVHYLCGAQHGGTGFFRHRPTGFETLDPARVEVFNKAMDDKTTLSYGYPAGDSADFALIGACEAHMDRLVIYRSSLFHSGLIRALPEHAEDPRRGRLTGNLFLQCEVAR